MTNMFSNNNGGVCVLTYILILLIEVTQVGIEEVHVLNFVSQPRLKISQNKQLWLMQSCGLGTDQATQS